MSATLTPNAGSTSFRASATLVLSMASYDVTRGALPCRVLGASFGLVDGETSLPTVSPAPVCASGSTDTSSELTSTVSPTVTSARAAHRRGAARGPREVGEEVARDSRGSLPWTIERQKYDGYRISRQYASMRVNMRQSASICAMIIALALLIASSIIRRRILGGILV